MNPYKGRAYNDLSRTDKISRAQKMINDGVPITVICRILNISPIHLQNLRQQGDAEFM